MNTLPAPESRIGLPAPADDLCLTFANTRYWRGRADPVETLQAPADLLHWLQEPGGWPADAAFTSGEISGRHLTEAVALRETMFRIFAASARGEPVAGPDIIVLNRALAEAPRRETVATDGAVWRWDVPLRERLSVSTLLAPVLWSAGDLLLGRRATRVRQCANPECGWLFLDDSKSGNRRWCSMASCGNRAKAHRHYSKRKAVASSSGSA